MTSEIKGYIHQNYETLNNTTEEPNTFLLGEWHDDAEVLRVNGLFISKFATPNDTLLIEGLKKLTPHPRPQEILREQKIYSALLDRNKIFGWDIDMSTYIPFEAGIQETLAICGQIEEEKDFEQLLGIDWQDTLTEPFTDSDESGSEFEAIKEAFISIGEEMNEWISKEVKPLLPRKGKERKEALAKLLDAKMRELTSRLENRVILDFPERTESMIHTLETVRARMASHEKIFLIAGIQHLEERTDTPESAKEAFSLKPLREFLERHPNIVVLKPKNLK